MNSISKMFPHQLSLRSRSHLWNAALLLAAAAIALAAERLSAAPEPGPVGAPSASPEISPFVAPLAADSALPSFRQIVAVDPFDSRGGRTPQSTVASGGPVPTVTSAPTARPQGGRQLTAILIADERRVAVIDESTVKVGDVLRDGSRVSAIQPDRVWVVEKDGRWQMLTLTTRGR
jgi:hypothetical protein